MPRAFMCVTNNTMSKRILSFLLAICLMVTTLMAGVTISDTAVPVEAATAGSALNYQNFRQTDQNYGNYDPSNGSGCTIQKNGCGIISIVNAVYHLTGNIISLKDLFDWALSTGGYGTSGTSRWTLYPALKTSSFPAKYGFSVGTMKDGNVSEAAFISHLQNGGTAIVHVYNHFMCIAGYDSASGRYLLIDPAPNWDTRHSSAGGNWMTAAELTGGINSYYLTIDWWCLLSKATASGTTYTATTNVTSGQGSVFFYDDVSSAKFTAGTAVLFRPVPASGYKVSSVTVNGAAVAVQASGNPSIYSFTMPSGNCTINVGFSTGGAGHANSTITSAASYTLPAGIVTRSDSARPNSYVGLFQNSTTSYSKSTAITYFSAPAYYFKDNATAEGYTTQLQAGKLGGNYGAYGSGGTFKVVTFDTSGNVYSNSAITLSGSDSHAAVLTYGRGSTPNPDPEPTPTTYTVTAKVAAGQGTVHFGDNVTTAEVTVGTTVNYQVTPAAGYKATKILVYGTSQTIKNNGGDAVYQFTMEAADATVSVTFEQDFASSLDPTDIIFDCDAAGQWVSLSTLNATSIALDRTAKGDTALKITASASNDPSMTLNYDLLNDLSAGTYKYMIVTAMTSAENAAAKMYLCPGSVTGPTEDCTATWSWNNDGLWHDYIIDLSGLSTWTGNLNSIRFDYFDGTTAANSVLWLRSIRFVSSKPSSPTVKTGSAAYAVGDAITYTYSGLDSYQNTNQNPVFFVGIYKKGEKPGSVGSQLYKVITANSGSGNITTSATGGTMNGQTLPAGNYTMWIAYDATGTTGVNNLNNVMFDNASSSYDFVIEEAAVGDVIVKVNTSDIEATAGKTVASAIVELNSLLGATTTITKNGETVSNTATLGTGMVATAGGKSYDIIIDGDVDGDGLVNIADATAVMADIKGTADITGAYAQAALNCTGRTGSLNILEIMAILNKI